MCKENYRLWSEANRPDDRLVRVEAMDFTWVLPWSVVREDVASGFAILMDDPA